MPHALPKSLGVAALALGGFWGLRAGAAAVQSLFSAGNVLQSNVQSELTATNVDALLGKTQLLLLALGAVALVHALAPERRSNAPERPWRRAAPFAVVSAVALAFGVYATLCRSTVVFGQRYFFLRDDAMTSMIYARNLIDGHGLVYAPGERVEGYTNFLWTLVMAAVHALGAGPAHAPAWVMLAGWLCVAASACIVVDLLRSRGLDTAWSVCAALAVVCDQNVMTWALSGFETSALTLSVCVCAWSLARPAPRVFAAALATVPLWRSDGLLLAAGLSLCLGAVAGFSRAWWRAIAPALLLSAAHFAFRWTYYGHAFPNTYYLKMIDWPDRLQVGLGGYGLRLVAQYPLLGALGLASLARGRPPLERGLALLALAQCGYAIYIGGDIFRYLRFVTPVLPLLYALAALRLHGWLQPHAAGAQLFARGALLAVCPVLASLGRLGLPPDESGFFRSSLSLARLLEANTPAGTLATIYPAGTIPYHAARQRFVDVFGKNDTHIAHRARYEGLIIGHNKLDFDYVYDQRRPAVAIVQSPCAVIERYLAAGAAERARLRELLGKDDALARFYDVAHPTFLREYREHRVVYVDRPTPTPMECVFLRAGAPISRFWSMSGAPPRPRQVHVDASLDAARDGVWFGPSWPSPEVAGGRSGRRLPADGSASIEVWIELDEPLSVTLCVASSEVDSAEPPLSLALNGEPIALEGAFGGVCDGLRWTGSVSQKTLAQSAYGTRIELAARAGAAPLLEWIELMPEHGGSRLAGAP